jgi:hypothetical protein
MVDTGKYERCLFLLRSVVNHSHPDPQNKQTNKQKSFFPVLSRVLIYERGAGSVANRAC